MFFNNCRLTNVSLSKFEIKHFELVARCLNKWKNTNGFGYNRLITLPGATVSLITSAFGQSYFSNCNNRRMTFAHAGILLSFMQRIDENLVTLKDFDYFCSLGYITANFVKRVRDVMYTK